MPLHIARIAHMRKTALHCTASALQAVVLLCTMRQHAQWAGAKAESH